MQGINYNKVRLVVSELEKNFQYLHYETIIRYCEISKLNRFEQLEVYKDTQYKISYTSTI